MSTKLLTKKSPLVILPISHGAKKECGTLLYLINLDYITLIFIMQIERSVIFLWEEELMEWVLSIRLKIEN